MLSKLATWLLNISGWKINGDFPDLKKYIIVGAPHTSNWDFVIAILLKFSRKLKANYIIKKEWLRSPFGWFFKLTGAIPVDRKKSEGKVEAIARTCKEAEQFVVGIAPEGTRQRVEKISYGFYHIAHLAQVPLVLIRMDFGNRMYDILPPFFLSGDMDADLEKILAVFQGVQGKHPEMSIFSSPST
ncbi:MAG: 1-acyl-sn-glycerol-3-phosphate acyltransferase [Bacteroidota bacterium]